MSGRPRFVFDLSPEIKFQSPDGDSLCPDYKAERVSTWTGDLFQSPDGDSLCPDTSVQSIEKSGCNVVSVP